MINYLDQVDQEEDAMSPIASSSIPRNTGSVIIRAFAKVHELKSYAGYPTRSTRSW